mmetsp:Transcript_54722/g.132880  ORF Transcript_54722/g.132880 Transcript_54722/m.132880 type:complete len:249 (+) Transcript_54722:947-1693(+)
MMVYSCLDRVFVCRKLFIGADASIFLRLGRVHSLRTLFVQVKRRYLVRFGITCYRRSYVHSPPKRKRTIFQSMTVSLMEVTFCYRDATFPAVPELNAALPTNCMRTNKLLAVFDVGRDDEVSILEVVIGRHTTCTTRQNNCKCGNLFGGIKSLVCCLVLLFISCTRRCGEVTAPSFRVLRRLRPLVVVAWTADGDCRCRCRCVRRHCSGFNIYNLWFFLLTMIYNMCRRDHSTLIIKRRGYKIRRSRR